MTGTKEWKVKSSEMRYNSKYMSVFEDKIRLPTGQEIAYSRVELRDFVSVLSLIQDKIVMIEIYRYPANTISLEIPSGYVENGESISDSARRELLEETGYRARSLSLKSWFYPWTRSKHKAYVVQAADLVEDKKRPEEAEQIRVKLLPIEEVRKRLKANQITHAPTIIALQDFMLNAEGSSSANDVKNRSLFAKRKQRIYRSSITRQWRKEAML